MKSGGAIAILGGLAMAGAAAPAFAHHSQAMFDREKTVTIQGVVKSWQYTNPHAWLEVVAPGADGKLVDWTLESSGTLDLARSGVRRDSFMEGDKVTARTHPLKDGRPGGSLIDATKADGTVIGRKGPG